MNLPATSDTIVAVSSAWQPAALGVIRLSGPDAAPIAAHVLDNLPPIDPRGRPTFLDTRLRIAGGFCPPATVYRFVAPRSYTAQDVIELHTVGSLPLLRALCDALVAAGARRALPGEFSARAFLAGRIAPQQVRGIQELIAASDAAAARRAARAALDSSRSLREQLVERLTDVLARVEAGIDFVDEEDVRFITQDELCVELSAALATLDELARRPRHAAAGLQPHVALAGLPNAGKSTLFNALLGSSRAIVSPTIGTTRDVLSAPIQIAGVELVLQDCAGLTATVDDLELAAHHAAERAADLADLVIWVHDARAEWSDIECTAWERLSPQRRLLVLSKVDQPGAPGAAADDRTLRVAARIGAGLDALRAEIVARLADHARCSDSPDELDREIPAALRRALSCSVTRNPELVAGEIRHALGDLRGAAVQIDDVLGRIFARFCVGK